MRNLTRAVVAVGGSAVLALSGAGFASATEAPDCTTSEAHDSAQSALDTATANVATQQATVDRLMAAYTDASSARGLANAANNTAIATLASTTEARGVAASALRTAQTGAIGAAEDVTYRQGLIDAFKAKYVPAQATLDAAQTKLADDTRQLAKSPTNRKLIERVAVDNAAVIEAQGPVDHYGPKGQSTQQSHLDKSQALLDAVTEAQSTMDTATNARGVAASDARNAQRAFDAASAAFDTAKSDAASANTVLKTAKATLAALGPVLPVCDVIVPPVDTDPGTGSSDPGTGGDTSAPVTSDPAPANSVPATVAPASVRTSTVPAAVVSRVVTRNASQAAPKHVATVTPASEQSPAPVAAKNLAYTGSSDVLPWLAGGAGVLVLAGAGTLAYARRS